MIYCSLYIGAGLEKYSNYLTGFRLILCYIGRAGKHLDYVTALGLIKLLKQGCHWERMKILLNYQQSNLISLGQTRCGV